MANPWTVTPESVTLNLEWKTPDNDVLPFWIKIKKYLTVGEERAVQTAGWRGVTGLGEAGDRNDAEIRIDWKATSFARAIAYLVDWGLEDDKHNRMPLNQNSLQALHPEVFELIESAINQHVKDMEEEKKARASNIALTPTSA